MLTRDEVVDVAAEIMQRIRDANDLKEPERTQRVTSHLGLNVRHMNGIGDAIIEMEFQMDPLVVRYMSHATVAAVQLAMAVGIELGKRIERESHAG